MKKIVLGLFIVGNIAFGNTIKVSNFIKGKFKALGRQNIIVTSVSRRGTTKNIYFEVKGRYTEKGKKINFENKVIKYGEGFYEIVTY